MRKTVIAVPSALLLVALGCAPEPLPNRAIPAEVAQVSAMTPTSGPTQTTEQRNISHEAAPAPSTPEVHSLWMVLDLDHVTYSDADQLAAVSPSFRDFAVRSMSASDTDGCTVLGLSVSRSHPDGFVVGSVSTDCGGRRVVWAENDEGAWKAAKMFEEPPLCSGLSHIGLPPGSGLSCEDDAGSLGEH